MNDTAIIIPLSEEEVGAMSDEEFTEAWAALGHLMRIKALAKIKQAAHDRRSEGQKGRKAPNGA